MARRDAGAIASGVVEGLRRGSPLDINQASVRQLEGLPGLNSPQAHAIVEGRPYRETSELIHRHILEKREYDRIKTQIVAK